MYNFHLIVYTVPIVRYVNDSFIVYRLVHYKKEIYKCVFTYIAIQILRRYIPLFKNVFIV